MLYHSLEMKRCDSVKKSADLRTDAAICFLSLYYITYSSTQPTPSATLLITTRIVTLIRRILASFLEFLVLLKIFIEGLSVPNGISEAFFFSLSFLVHIFIHLHQKVSLFILETIVEGNLHGIARG